MDNFFRLLFIWSMPVTISMAVVIAVRHRFGIHLGDSIFTNNNRGLRHNLDPFFSAALPVVLILIHHPFMMAFIKQYSAHETKTDMHRRKYQALANLLTHIFLALICTLLFAAAIATKPQTGMPGLLYYWPKAGIFFNVTMGFMHLLPWPPFLLGTLLTNPLSGLISDRTGVIVGAALVLAIPADYGYGYLVFPVYHWLCAVAGL